MAEDEEDRRIVTEVNLEELMEVVTSYKCRFCDFTSNTTAEMSSHLQKTHMTANSSKASPAEPDTVQNDTGVESKSNNTPDPELVCEEDDSQAENQPSYSVPALLSNLGLAPITSPSSPSLVVQSSLPDPKVLTNQVRSVAKSLPIMASTQQDLGLISLTTSAGAQSLPITNLQLTGSGLTLATAATTMDTISVPLVDSTKDLGTGPSSIAPITRELFLCGVCSVGFISVAECRYHMDREHSTSVDTTNVSDTVVDKYEQRISVGTQATGKRPGRKRKSELPPPLPNPAPGGKGKETRGLKEDEEVDENTDEDWLPGRSLSTGTRDGRQRRKIRTPKALKEDYVIEKKRKYRKRRMVIKESYTLACSYLGCSTKFRCQESLNIHLDCHNKEDDAFTCPNCLKVFDVWKPLRIHLWRSHFVDCDMFQCDLCEYKTDTLHKLGIHREIHSDNRPYTCDVCGKGFKQLSQMKNHQIIHAEHQRSDRPTWSSNKTCDVCKRTFANSKCLKKHVEAVHGQNKPFKCQYCNHTTAWKAMLILHERTHTGEKPFKCDVCPYATGDHNSLRRHKMRHTGQRQYKCHLCAYTCIQTISLKTHMRNKHPNAEGIYVCQLCKFRTVNKQIYNNHLEDHRNGLVPDAKDTAPASQNSPLPVDQVAASMVPTPEGALQFQLQVKRMDTGELHANKEDIDKLNNIPELVHSGMDANQLIYSALNIGSQNHIGSLTYTAQLINGVQCTVSPSLPSSKDVLSSYLITFFAPPLVDETQATSGGQAMVYQSTAETGVSAVEEAGNQDESSQLSSQGAEQDGEAMMTLAEVSQAQNMEQVTQILYTQVPQEMESSQHVQVDMAPQEQQNTGFRVIQVASGDDSAPVDDVEGRIQKVRGNFSGTEGPVVVSEAGHIMEGMEGVLLTEGGRSIVVMEGGQVVERMLVMAADDVEPHRSVAGSVCDSVAAVVDEGGYRDTDSAVVNGENREVHGTCNTGASEKYERKHEVAMAEDDLEEEQADTEGICEATTTSQVVTLKTEKGEQLSCAEHITEMQEEPVANQGQS